MIWLVFAFLAALFESMKNFFSKKSLKDIDEYVAAWSLNFFALPFLVPLLFFIKIPSLGIQFFMAFLIAGFTGVTSAILYMKAIKHSDLSITVPIVAFTPLFLLITSPLIVHEFPSAFGLLGVILIVIGSYVLNIKEKRKGYLKPFKALFKEKGPKLMLIVAFLWAIGTNYDKICVQNSSSIFYVIVSILFDSLALSIIMLYKSRKNLQQIRESIKSLIPIGFSWALTMIFQMAAINIAFVSYVISVKRLNVIFSVLIGYFVFKEKGIKERLAGAIIMVLGVILIALS
jgi:uncharacterized membrane protein